jgi:hypothetical protein
VPSLAAEQHWTTTLLKEQSQDIVENLRLQIGASTRAQIFNAIRFYVDNDAFIIMSG